MAVLPRGSCSFGRPTHPHVLVWSVLQPFSHGDIAIDKVRSRHPSPIAPGRFLSAVLLQKKFVLVIIAAAGRMTDITRLQEEPGSSE